MRSTEVRLFVVFVVLAVGKPIKRIRWLPFRDFLETFEAPVSPGRRGLRNMEPVVLHSLSALTAAFDVVIDATAWSQIFDDFQRQGGGIDGAGDRQIGVAQIKHDGFGAGYFGVVQHE